MRKYTKIICIVLFAVVGSVMLQSCGGAKKGCPERISIQP